MDITYSLPYNTVPAPGYLLEGAGISGLAANAEAAGFARIALTDHPAPSQAWREAGGHDTVDPFVGLAFAAASTTRVRLLTYLTVLPYRNPFHLAKVVASLDSLAGGRVDLGVGVGYLKSEFRALGVGWDERNALFDEAVTVLREAWKGAPVTLEARRFSARGTVIVPPCRQVDGPPLWIGGNSKLTLRRVVNLGAGWLPMPNAHATSVHLRSPALETVDDFKRLLDYARGYAHQMNSQPPTCIMYALPDAPDRDAMKAQLELVHHAHEAGATCFAVNGRGRTRKEADAWIADFADVVLGHLGSG